MFVVKKEDATLEAQSGTLYAPPAPDFAIGTYGNGIARNYPEHEF